MKDEWTDGGIFINYRQRDSRNGLRNHAILVEALSRRLARHFGERMVFIDTSMSSGTRYPNELRAKLTTCRVLLAVIHPEWLEDLHRRRNKQETDWVLEEISTALSGSPHSGNQISQRPAVIPVILEDTRFPHADELPEEIRQVTELKTFCFQFHSLEDDIVGLLEELERQIPPPWLPLPIPEAKPEKFGMSFSLIVSTAILTANLASHLLFVNPLVVLVAGTIIFMGFAISGPLIAAIFWIFGRQFRRIDLQMTSLPTTKQRTVKSIGVGAVVVSFTMIFRLVNENDSFRSATTYGFISLMVFIGALLFVLTAYAQAWREDHEWPPRVRALGAPDRPAALRRALVLLEERLTSSWRPPLSRVQRDQAQHIVQELSKAVGVLHDEAEHSRLHWLRTEHRRTAITYVILSIGLTVLAGISTYLLLDLNYAGKWLYPVALTPIIAPASCLGTMELWFRYERKERRWLATEIETNLEKRLLPHLPPRRVTELYRISSERHPTVTDQQYIRDPLLSHPRML